jgi:ATP-dependent helicase IRC3
VSGGDFKSKELSDAIDNPERNQLVVKGWLDYGQERQTIGFTAGIKHAKNLAEMFQQHGISAQAVWGDDPSRVDKLSDFKTSKITVLLNCALLTEGIDIWQVGCIMHTSPTQSKVNYTQRIGRGTRLEEGCPNLLSLDSSHVFKKDCIVLDFCDVSSRHSLASLPTLFGLPEKLNLNGKDVVWAVKELEKVQEEFSHLDFTSLKDIDAISLFVQETNLFEVKVPPELEDASQFTWHPSISGGYVLMLPEKESRIQSVKIEQNLLDKWQIKAYLKGKRYAGQRDTMEEAFSAADDLVRKIAPEALTVVKREAFWHNNPASKKQLWRLRRLYKGKQIPKDLTSGEASNLIGSALAGKG